MSLDRWLTRTDGTPDQKGKKFQPTSSGRLQGAKKTETYKPSVEVEPKKEEPEIKFVEMATGKELTEEEMFRKQPMPELEEVSEREKHVSTGWTGNKYQQTKDLPLKDIAQLIKKEVLAKHPDIKVGVKTEHYSGGRSIDVRVTDAPFKAFKKVQDDPNDRYPTMRYTDKGKELIDSINGIIRQYNYDRSDLMSDYFEGRFHADADFGFELHQKEAKELGLPT